jgi:hypothetical protein
VITFVDHFFGSGASGTDSLRPSKRCTPIKVASTSCEVDCTA